MLAELDLRFESKDEWARESWEKRELAAVELHEGALGLGLQEELLRPVAMDECESLLCLVLDELFREDWRCCCSVQDATGGE